jgi:hypothetical protein
MMRVIAVDHYVRFRTSGGRTAGNENASLYDDVIDDIGVLDFIPYEYLDQPRPHVFMRGIWCWSHFQFPIDKFVPITFPSIRVFEFIQGQGSALIRSREIELARHTLLLVVHAFNYTRIRRPGASLARCKHVEPPIPGGIDGSI